jgi:cytochrome c peroxidase
MATGGRPGGHRIILASAYGWPGRHNYCLDARLEPVTTNGLFSQREIAMNISKTLLAALLTTGICSNTDAAPLPGPVLDSDYYNNGTPAAAKVELGRNLFFDKIISGNKNISCATCHHPQFSGGDGLSLPVGEGGTGLGINRLTGSGASAIKDRIGRNSPPLFNLGAKEFVNLNWQGRHEQKSTGLSLPCVLGPVNACPTGLDNVLAGQNLFPLVNVPEMTGHARENEVADAPGLTTGVSRFPLMWDAIMARLRANPEYVTQFRSVYGLNSANDMKIQHLVNALAAFQATAFRSDKSPFDALLRGNTAALGSIQKQGMTLFYGSAGCANCHSGKFQTDQKFHAIAMPQLGSGVFVSGRSEGQRDIGRAEVTALASDNFKFRTPSLRNVALTAPYGHTGAYATLKDVIRHHLNPVSSFNSWNRNQVTLPALPTGLLLNDFAVMDDPVKAAEITAANELAPSTLTDSQIDAIITFMNALTDPNVANLITLVPSTVPSGLPVAD